ncbi:hypothetical protein C8R46DRAFT_1047423 [Mycena filopes]|nr:hypothetical protein C8R46DRAFT_1047423 [Mycena filopes]
MVSCKPKVLKPENDIRRKTGRNLEHFAIRGGGLSLDCKWEPEGVPARFDPKSKPGAVVKPMLADTACQLPPSRFSTLDGVSTPSCGVLETLNSRAAPRWSHFDGASSSSTVHSLVSIANLSCDRFKIPPTFNASLAVIQTNIKPVFLLFKQTPDGISLGSWNKLVLLSHPRRVLELAGLVAAARQVTAAPKNQRFLSASGLPQARLEGATGMSRAPVQICDSPRPGPGASTTRKLDSRHSYYNALSFHPPSTRLPIRSSNSDTGGFCAGQPEQCSPQAQGLGTQGLGSRLWPRAWVFCLATQPLVKALDDGISSTNPRTITDKRTIFFREEEFQGGGITLSFLNQDEKPSANRFMASGSTRKSSSMSIFEFKFQRTCFSSPVTGGWLVSDSLAIPRPIAFVVTDGTPEQRLILPGDPKLVRFKARSWEWERAFCVQICVGVFGPSSSRENIPFRSIEQWLHVKPVTKLPQVKTRTQKELADRA